MVNLEDKYKQKVIESYLNNLPYHIWIKDDKHRYVYVNECYLKSIGRKSEEVIGRTDFELFPLYNSVLLFKQDMKVLKMHEAMSSEFKINYDSKTKLYKNYKAPLGCCGKKSNWIYCIEKEIVFENNSDENFENSIYCLKKYRNKKDSYYTRILNISNNLMNNLKADGVSITLYNKKPQLSMYLCIARDNKTKTRFIVELNKSQLNYTKNSNNIFSKSNYLNEDNIKTNIKTYTISYDNEILGFLNIYYYKKNCSIYNYDEYIQQTCEKYAVLLKNRVLSKCLNNELFKRRESDEILELFLGTAADLCGIIRTKEDGHAYFEKLTWKWLDIFGYRKEELYNVQIIDMIHPEDRNKVEYLFENKKKIMQKKGLFIRFKCKSGEYKEIKWSFRYLNSEDKIVFTGKDVTENKYLCSEKKRLTQKAYVEELKTEFFSKLSHEFKTPLNIILATVQLINKDMLTIDKAYNYVKGIRQNSYRLLRLVNNLIDTAKIERKSLELNLINSNIVEAVEDVVDSVINTIGDKSSRKIIFDTEEEEIITCFDVERIGKVVYNLMSNAIKFTNDNGNIIVKVLADNKKENVIVSVYDDGYGINKEMSERLFDKSTKEDYFLIQNHECSSIGLYLTKSIVELHGGSIGINKKIENGTEIYFTLPLSKIENLETNIYYSRSIDAQIEACNIELSDIDLLL